MWDFMSPLPEPNAGLGFKQEASAVLRHLPDLKPDEETARQAQTELDKIQPTH